MENSRIDAVGLLLAAAAVTFALSNPQITFGYLTTLGGLSLLIILFTYDGQGYRSGGQSLAFAAAGGGCLALAGGYVLRLVSSASEPKPDPAGFEQWLSIAWVAGTLVLWGIDRARMGSRGQATLGTSAYTPSAAPVSIPVPPPPPPQPVFRQPEPVVPTYVPPPPVVQPVEPIEAPFAAEPVQPAHAEPVPVHVIPPGKEVTLYVNLVGEAMNMLRAVRAENLGRDFYLIADEMPEGETWEFKPGQIVRAKKKSLSSGKALVAFEEAPRAN